MHRVPCVSTLATDRLLVDVSTHSTLPDAYNYSTSFFISSKYEKRVHIRLCIVVASAGKSVEMRLLQNADQVDGSVACATHVRASAIRPNNL